MLSRWLVVLALACMRPSAEDRVTKEVLQQWERGYGYYEEARFEEAVQAFSQAVAVQPEDALLRSWYAAALASAGNLDEAIAQLEKVVNSTGDVALAQYNLASYLARADRKEEAAKHLKRALQDGARLSWQAAGDDDFSDLLQDEAFSFLPDSPLVVTFTGPAGDLFTGAEFMVEMRVIGAASEVVSIERGVLPKGLELLSVVEDSWPSVEGLVRQISWKLRVCAWGSYTLGKLHVKTPSAQTTVQGSQLVVLGDAAVPTRACGFERRLQTVEQVAAQLAEKLSVLHEGEDWWVKFTPDQLLTVQTTLQSPGPIVYERRDRGQTLWTVRQLRPARNQPLKATLRRGEVLVWGTP